MSRQDAKWLVAGRKNRPDEGKRRHAASLKNVAQGNAIANRKRGSPPPDGRVNVNDRRDSAESTRSF